MMYEELLADYMDMEHEMAVSVYLPRSRRSRKDAAVKVKGVVLRAAPFLMGGRRRNGGMQTDCAPYQ